MIKALLSNKLVKSGALYSASALFKSITGMATGLLILRWLQPAELGLWQAVTIIQAYLPFAQLGVQSGLNRDLPILIGKGEIDKTNSFVATSKYFALFLALLFLVLSIVIAAILWLLGKPLSLMLGIATIGFMAASFSYQNHLSATFRSQKSFNKLIYVNYIHSFFLLGLLYFVYAYHYYGILIYNVLSYVVIVALMHFVRPFQNVQPKFKLEDFKYLVKNGLILMSFNQIRSAAQSIPKLIILKLRGTQILGLYSPALAVNTLFTVLPAAIAQFFQPQMGFRYGTTGMAKDLWPPTRKLFLLLIFVSIPIALIFWFSAPYLLLYLFPKYTESLESMRIMSVAFIFSSAYTTHGVLHSIKAYRYAYIYSIAEFIGYLIFPFLFAYIMEDVLVAISFGILVNNFLLAMLNYQLIRYALLLPKYNLSK